MKRDVLLFVLCVSTLSIVSPLSAQRLWDRQHMEQIKADLNSPNYSAAYQRLLLQAETALKAPLYSVTEKAGTAPSGDKHDYVSLSRYWWPNPETTSKLPYINKDGVSNPELEQYDRNTLGAMCSAVNTLALAYFYSGKERYADKASDLLRVWFVDTATRMNPNLNYSQFIPGRNDSKGRPEGLIDSYSFVEMLSSVALLTGSQSYTEADELALKQWFGDFAVWMQVSEQGRRERMAKNNHATAYDSQLATYLLFSGDEQSAKKIIYAFPEKRIFTQIEPDGTQPNELWRTLAYHYSQYNLSHMLDLCATAKSLGIELLQQQSADGRSITKAMDYLISFIGKDVTSWPYKQISGWEAKQRQVCQDMLRLSYLSGRKAHYQSLYQQHAKEDLAGRWRLLYGAINEE